MFKKHLFGKRSVAAVVGLACTLILAGTTSVAAAAPPEPAPAMPAQVRVQTLNPGAPLQGLADAEYQPLMTALANSIKDSSGHPLLGLGPSCTSARPYQNGGQTNIDRLDYSLSVADGCLQFVTVALPPDVSPGPPALLQCLARCATSHGEPHLRTFDGAFYNFQLVGEFIAAKSDRDDFQIQVRQRPYKGTSNTVAENSAVAMQVAGHRVGVYLTHPGHKILLDGTQITPTATASALPGGGTVADNTTAGLVTVTWPDGSYITIVYANGYLDISLCVAVVQYGHLSGLFGNDDGNPGNDFADRSGTVILPYPPTPTPAQINGTFSPIWRISQAESLFDYDAGQSTTTFTDTSFPTVITTVADLPPATRTAATTTCHNGGVFVEPFLDDCVLDVAVTGDSSTVTSAAGSQGFTSDTAFITNKGSNTMTPIDLYTNTAGTPITVGATPAGIATTPGHNNAYVTNSGSNTVTPIDLGTNTAGSPVPVGTNPTGIAITPDGATAYVTNSGSNTVTPITVATNTAGSPIPVSTNPTGIAIR